MWFGLKHECYRLDAQNTWIAAKCDKRALVVRNDGALSRFHTMNTAGASLPALFPRDGQLGEYVFECPASFDSAKYELDTPFDFAANGNPFSYSGWVKIPGPSSLATVCTKGTASGNFVWALFAGTSYGSPMGVQFQVSGGTPNVEGDLTNLQYGKWHRIGIVHTWVGRTELWFDNRIISSTPNTGTSGRTWGTMLIASYSSLRSGGWRYADQRFYNRALAPGEMRHLGIRPYWADEQQTGLFFIPGAPPSPGNQVSGTSTVQYDGTANVQIQPAVFQNVTGISPVQFDGTLNAKVQGADVQVRATSSVRYDGNLTVKGEKRLSGTSPKQFDGSLNAQTSSPGLQRVRGTSPNAFEGTLDLRADRRVLGASQVRYDGNMLVRGATIPSSAGIDYSVRTLRPDYRVGTLRPDYRV